MNRRIAIVEDDPLAAQVLAGIVRTIPRTEVRVISDPRNLVTTLAGWPPTIVMLDLTLPGRSGDSVLVEVQERFPETLVVVATGQTDAQTAVRLLRAGAFDYLTKPLEIEAVRAALERTLTHATVVAERQALSDRFLRRDRELHPAFSGFITEDPHLKDVLRYTEAIATSTRSVLITGETGTGKDVLARAIHAISERFGPYVVCNLGGMDDPLVSDVLFGHRKGDFTGAINDRAGLVETARGGTLFLDEIGDLPLPTQIKLLRLLQDGDYFPVGDDQPRQADIRVIAATSQDLEARITSDHFRRDLYYRLAAHQIHLPPLRERLGDLSLLVPYFVRRAAVAADRPLPVIDPGFLVALTHHGLPGNVRELDALVVDALARHRDGEPWTAADIHQGARRHTLPDKPREDVHWPLQLPTLEEAQASLLDEALRRTNGNQTQAAKLIGVTKQAISYRLRRRAGPTP